NGRRDDAGPGEPFGLCGEKAFFVRLAGGIRAARDQNADKNQDDAERNRKKARPHARERAHAVSLALERGARAEKYHQRAAIVIAFESAGPRQTLPLRELDAHFYELLRGRLFSRGKRVAWQVAARHLCVEICSAIG